MNFLTLQNWMIPRCVCVRVCMRVCLPHFICLVTDRHLCCLSLSLTVNDGGQTALFEAAEV